jgi:hypothetical protein
VKKIAPPGWEPHQIVRRVDGWIFDHENPDLIPPGVARMIVQNMPSLSGDSIADIKARMLARHRALEHRRKRKRAIIKRMAQSRHA